jgi:hypothetical protein
MHSMRRSAAAVLVTTICAGAMLSAQRGAAPAGPGDPLAGAWRGTLRSGADTQTALVISIVKKGDEYSGVVNTGGTTEAPIRKINLTGNRLAVDAGSDSKLGDVALTTELMVDGNKATGSGVFSIGAHRFPVTIELTRRPRAEVIQPQVAQRADYFVGRWTFEYLGGEFPPLSTGSRTGTATFTKTGSSNFVTGVIENDLGGKKSQDRITLGFDPETRMLAVVERRADQTELISVASWQSPLAISFTTSPVVSGGRTHQLRRVIQVLNEQSFDIVEEFSIDGGAFRRLGNARYSKEN